jgi:Flp pilus assembly pilin Flp
MAVRTMKQSGQTFAEYGMVVMLIGIAVIATLTLMGHSVFGLYHNASVAMPR